MSRTSKSAREIRAQFLKYFAGNGHEVVRSSSLVPHNDPTLMFTNAGMNQFKDVFTGRETRPYKRAASSQKCVRAGGKHNDLENVGRTARHHTFFEMLGNFSFGDYFKADAIRFAWELLTREYKIDPSRMMFTVFGGDASLGIAADDEARGLWKQIAGVGDDRVLGLGLKDNFWMMGDTGPQGPCSEIHYHQGDHLPCPEPKCLGPACDCDRWLEIWNLVFMQYEKKTQSGPLEKLPAPSIDTGMGLERVTAVIQGLETNYATDLLTPYIRRAEELSKKKYGADSEDDTSMRVIADHARATAFLVADGVFPDKAGREYVLRRIFRRAVRHGKRLGIDEPFMHIVCGDVVTEMGQDFPELGDRKQVIARVTLEEETRFRQTLDRGLKLLEEEIGKLGKKHTSIPGDVVFKLYDTFGFPTDLTAIIAAERGLGIDQAGFDTAMAKQQNQGDFAGQDKAVEDIYKSLGQELGATEFVGYEGHTGTAKIRALLASGQRAERAGVGDQVAIVTSATPFYGEAGGQIGDTGTIVTPGGSVRVTDAQKPAQDMIVHLGVVESGSLAVGDTATLTVEGDRRERIRANHSATHLLHHALRKILGEHVTQKGSLVAPDRLRFDFSHFAPMTEDEKRRVEDLVNDEVRANVDTQVKVVGFDDARKEGAMALFGEKYGDRVRVMRIGRESVELCGGTHVRRSGDIGLFKILSEGGVAQGVRRLEAVTGVGALEHVRRLEGELGKAGAVLKAGPFDVAARVERLHKELKDAGREIEALRGKLAAGGARDLLSEVREVAGVKLLVTRTDVADPKALRDVGDKLKERIGSGIIVLGGAADGKVALLALVTADLTSRFHAGKIVGEIAKEVGGKGGGRPDMAQAGGTQPENLDRALEKVASLLK